MAQTRWWSCARRRRPPSATPPTDRIPRWPAAPTTPPSSSPRAPAWSWPSPKTRARPPRFTRLRSTGTRPVDPRPNPSTRTSRRPGGPSHPGRSSLQYHPRRLRIHRAPQEARGQGRGPAHRRARRPLGGSAARRRSAPGQRADPRTVEHLRSLVSEGEVTIEAALWFPTGQQLLDYVPRDRGGAANATRSSHSDLVPAYPPRKRLTSGFGFCPRNRHTTSWSPSRRATGRRC
jgi:hypothetical protein